MRSNNIRSVAVAVVALLTAALLTACGDESGADLVASAKRRLEIKDNNAALIQLKAALQKSPQSGEARFLLGKALLRTGDAPAAIIELNKAAEAKYSEDKVRPELARAMIESGQHKKLIEHYVDVKLQDSSALADLKTSIAAAYLQEGLRDQARVALNEALALSADFTPALILKARLKAAEGDIDTALEVVEEILKKHPDEYLAWQIKGDASLYGRSDKVAAMHAYRKAIEIEPRFLAGHAAVFALSLREKDTEGLTQQLASLQKALPNHPQTRFLEAQFAFIQQDTKRGRELIQQLLQKAPENARLLQLAGAIEYQGGGLVQAETYLNKAVQLAPEQSFSRRLLARIHLRNGQPQKALSTLAPLINRGGDAETLSIAAEAELLKGDNLAAEKYYLQAVKLNPTDANLRTAAALSRLTKQNNDAVFVELESIAATDKGNVAELALISAKLRKRDLDGALRTIDALERKQPNHPLAYQLRGRVQVEKKNIAEARASFERALLIDSNYFPAAAALAALDLEAGKTDMAKQRFGQLLKVNSRNVPALLALADVQARTGAKPEEAEELIRQAIKVAPNERAPRLMLVDQLLNQRRFKEALVTAQEASAALPEDPEILGRLAQAQLISGDSQQATNTYQRLAASNPKSVQIHLKMAAAYLVARNREAAAKSYRRALEISPGLAIAQASLIAIAMEERRFDEALKIARSIQATQPQQAAGWVYEGDIEAVQRHFDAAAVAYRSALRKEQASDIAVKLHRTLLGSGKEMDAAGVATEMDKAAPRDAGFQLYLGDHALVRGDFKAAELRYRFVISSQPRNVMALNNLAYVLVKQGKEGAVVLAEKANELLPGKPVLIDTLAVALAGERNYDRAIETHKSAIKLAPESGSLKLNLAKTYLLAGDKGQARKELETIKALGGKFTMQDEVAALLKSTE